MRRKREKIKQKQGSKNNAIKKHTSYILGIKTAMTIKNKKDIYII